MKLGAVTRVGYRFYVIVIFQGVDPSTDFVKNTAIKLDEASRITVDKVAFP